MNQSVFEAGTRGRRYARETACHQLTTGFGFTSEWLSARVFLAKHKT